MGQHPSGWDANEPDMDYLALESKPFESGTGILYLMYSVSKQVRKRENKYVITCCLWRHLLLPNTVDGER